MTIFEFPSAWLPLIDSIVKATMVLGAAGAAAFILRHASAALRHLIWTLALVGALLMPILSIALPRWQLPIVTVAAPVPVAALAAARDDLPAPRLRPSAHEPSRVDAIAGTGTSASSRSHASVPDARAISWQQAVVGLWLTGVLLIVGRILVGLIAVQWMTRRAERVLDAPWMKTAIALASEIGVSSNIMFLRNPRTVMPMACGVFRPVVMMPAEADEWPAERLRIVLLHELAHVRRRDCLTHVIAQLACAVHWFNPLAWVAARHVRTERERACDDLVLAAGTRGPDYADQLLEIARGARSGYRAVLAGASLAMAHRSQLEGRLMAILDPRVPHSALTRPRAMVATTICCAAVIPLAAVQPWGDSGRTVSAPIPVASAPAEPDRLQSPAPFPTPKPEPAPMSNSESTPVAEVTVRNPQSASTGSTAERTRTGTIDGYTSGTLTGTLSAIDDAVGEMLGERLVPHQNVIQVPHEASPNDQESKPAAGKGQSDPRMVAALTAALKDTDKEVRETALHALVQLRDPSVFEPLVQALKDSAAEVREQAAFALGELRDRRAVEPLSTALKDTNPDVREQAAFALGQLRDRAAAPALAAALKDADAEVREQVVFALGQLRDPASIEGLAIALRDSSASVREKAAFALGQLRDRRGVEPLISALKDSDADVREQAAFALGQIRERAAVEALVIALRDSSAAVREQVVFALGQLRDPRAIDGLTAALKDPQAGVRQQAAFALGQLAR